jgi:hypothetical protein
MRGTDTRDTTVAGIAKRAGAERIDPEWISCAAIDWAM